MHIDGDVTINVPAATIPDIAKQLETLAERLLANVPPGHVDYISKHDAGAWAKILAMELSGLTEESRCTSKN